MMEVVAAGHHGMRISAGDTATVAGLASVCEVKGGGDVCTTDLRLSRRVAVFVCRARPHTHGANGAAKYGALLSFQITWPTAAPRPSQSHLLLRTSDAVTPERGGIDVTFPDRNRPSPYGRVHAEHRLPSSSPRLVACRVP